MLRIEKQFDEIPEDSDASIQTAGLLGGKYIGIGPGGSETFLKEGGQIEFTQSAIVLESLVNKFFANMASKGPRCTDAQQETGQRRRMTRDESTADDAFIALLGGLAAAGQCGKRSRDRASSSRARRSPARRARGDRAAFRKDPDRSTSWSRNLLPHFDTPYAAQLVLGKHWRNATPEQRKRFVEAFYQSLLYTYGDAMVDFTGDRLKVFPTKVEAETIAPRCAPRSSAPTADRVAVNYSLRKSETAGRPGTWSSTASAT